MTIDRPSRARARRSGPTLVVGSGAQARASRRSGAGSPSGVACVSCPTREPFAVPPQTAAGKLRPARNGARGKRAKSGFAAKRTRERLQNKGFEACGCRVDRDIERNTGGPRKASPRSAGSCVWVGTILEGSVRKAGDRLRITAQLVDVANQGHLCLRHHRFSAD